MDMINVYIIIGRGFNKAKIVNEIEEEGYNHNFFFEQGQEWDVLTNNMHIADEIWVFGDATEYDTYRYAKTKGMDIWQMG